jgi:DNA adenine methylase
LKETIKYTKISFVYLDPPYYPENETSFTSYTSNDFDKEQHNKLIDFCKYIDSKNSKFLLSNSNTNYIKNNLKKYKIEVVDCKRQINSKNPGATAKEILIYN